jgi:hypothetical protein
MLLMLWTSAVSQQSPSGETSRPVLVRTKLTEVGATPFHLKATITEGREQDPIGRIEMFWLAPNKWRRTIEAQDFSQTMIVSGDLVYEQDSNDYFPLGVRVLATAAVDPGPLLDAHRPGDILLTKANGSSDESGRLSFGGQFNMCVQAKSGLLEQVGTPGYSI